MKTLIVYYSFTGNNRILAEALAARMNADILPITDKRRRTFMTILLDMLLNRRPGIRYPPIAWAQYDKAILISPVWNARIASPMCSFIATERQHLDGYAMVTLCGGRQGQETKITQQLTRLAGKPPRSLTQLPIKDRLPDERRKPEEMKGGVRIKSSDLEYFKADIDKILADYPEPVYR